MPKEFLSQLMYRTRDPEIKELVTNNFQDLAKIIELYEEWVAARKWTDDDLLDDPPGCFQC